MRSLSVLPIVLALLCEFGWLEAQEILSGQADSKPLKTMEGRAAESVSAGPGQSVTRLNGQSGSVTIVGSNGVLVPPSSAGKITITSNATPMNTPGALVARDASGGFAAGTLLLSGNLNLRGTERDASAGVLTLNREPFLHAVGLGNTFLGSNAGNLTLTGSGNSAVGNRALTSNTAGSDNSAFGLNALSRNDTGSDNSAFGGGALGSNTTGDRNSAFGTSVLSANVSGERNAAFGDFALVSNVSGNRNSAFGSQSMLFNAGGTDNSAFGDGALFGNTEGNGNAAFGAFALTANKTGISNSAFGTDALGNNATGIENSAFGRGALGSLRDGSSNTAVGVSAGMNLVGGSNNVYVGSGGAENFESDTIRIGTSQRAAYIAGISGQPVSGGAPVFVNERGQLGTMPSSRRYKEDIADMTDESDVLLRLRPVTFFYKAELDRARVRQYGLLAEDVAEVAPALVLRDSTGRPDSVRYPAVNAMLLKEVQKQRELLDQQRLRIDRQSSEIEDLRALVERLASRVSELGQDLPDVRAAD